jgi:hypothetical protein
MSKIALAAAALLSALASGCIQPASAWHLTSGRACLRHAFVPDCGPSKVAVCLSRRPCALEPHKTAQVCAGWRCEPRNQR